MKRGSKKECIIGEMEVKKAGKTRKTMRGKSKMRNVFQCVCVRAASPLKHSFVTVDCPVWDDRRPCPRQAAAAFENFNLGNTDL